MTLRSIDNKRVDLTDSEWELYQEICKSYDDERNQRYGKDLFSGLFETDDNGIIIFLRPPTSKFSSMEVYMFLVGVMVHQHLGVACDHVDALAVRMFEKEAILDKKLSELEDLLSRGNELLNRLENVES